MNRFVTSLSVSLVLSACLGACAGEVSLGPTGTNGSNLRPGDPCDPAQCTTRPDLACSGGPERTAKCVANANATCEWKLSSCESGGGCGPESCGPAPGMPSRACIDGTSDGPGRCLAQAGKCSWEIRTCDNLPADTTSLKVVQEGDGFGVAPPAGSECNLGQSTFTLPLATKSLAYAVCRMGATGTDPYRFTRGTRAVNDAEFQRISDAMAALAVPQPGACGADKPTLWVEVTRPSGATRYDDSFYQCQGKPGARYVDNIGGVFAAFQALVPQ